jgi:hypothetical protein
MNCANCGVPAPPSAISAALRAGRCASCQALFDVEQRERNGLRYQLCALLRGGTRRVLVRSLESEFEARSLETRLESLLGLADLPIAGELTKR